MILLDALSTEYRFVIWTVEMHHTVGVLLAEFLSHAIFILIIELEVALGQLSIFFNDFIQNIDIER